MSNQNDLLKGLALDLEAMAGRITVALATPDTPEPDIKETLRERYPGACLAACGVLIGCSSRITVLGQLELGGFCGRPRVCARYAVLELARDTVAASADDRLKCNSGGCAHYAGGGRCTATDRCLLADPELLQGYTLEQWGMIQKGGYLCEFSREEGCWKHAKMGLNGVFPERAALFTSARGHHYQFCRPAQIPGILRPWFGGERPVAAGATVLAKLRNGGSHVQPAHTLVWGIGGELPKEAEIVAYMEV